jgi:predicted amidohydrolase YtcJ
LSVTIFQNAHVFDGHRYRGHLGEVVVDRGRIAAVGGSGTPGGTPGGTPSGPPGDATVVDVAGGLLLPGFVDAHVHAIQGGLERLACDLSGVPVDEAAYLAHVGAYASTHPDDAWIRGGGWAMAAFPGGVPSAEALDKVVPDRPVALVNRDHHGMWVNSRALEVAGIHAGTPDPVDGRIERDEGGHPTGMLHEGAMRWVDDVLPTVDEDGMLAGFLEGQAHLHSFGITGWQDAIVGAYAGMQDNGPTYLRAAREGLITASVVGALWWDRDRGAEQIDDLVERRKALSHGRFSAAAVKIMQDGIIENGTAGLAEPYLDRCGHHTDNAGISFVDPARLPAYVASLDRLGFQVHVHAIGDRGVHEALDAFEGTDPQRRHHVAHLQLIEPDDIPRFHALGVAANLQALWACLDEQMTELTIPFLGAERSNRQYPFADLHRSGARLVAGSDWPVSTPNPLEAIHVAVHRVDHGGTARGGMEPFLPEQALPIEAAFAAYTSGSSWVNHRDDAGTITPGAVADLVVLDRDPFLDPDSIGAARVVSTWVDGAVVHQA